MDKFLQYIDRLDYLKADIPYPIEFIKTLPDEISNELKISIEDIMNIYRERFFRVLPYYYFHRGLDAPNKNQWNIAEDNFERVIKLGKYAKKYLIPSMLGIIASKMRINTKLFRLR